MKNIILVIIGVVVISAVAVFYDLYSAPKLVPVEVKSSEVVEYLSLGEVPEFSLKTIYGREASINDFRGKVVIINFWATWCSTCVIEMPDMLNLVDSYGGDVVFLAISSDMRIESINKFIAGSDDNIKDLFKSKDVFVVFDDKQPITYDIFMTQRYPETIIVSPKGEMVRKIVGEFNWAGDDIKSYISALILQK